MMSMAEAAALGNTVVLAVAPLAEGLATRPMAAMTVRSTGVGVPQENRRRPVNTETASNNPNLEVRNLEDQADPALQAIQIETAILAHLKNKRTNLRTNHQAKTRAQHPQLT